MDLTWPQLIVALAGIVLGPSGAVVVTLRTQLNGMRSQVERTDKTVERIESEVKTVVAGQAQNSERIARVETKLEGL